jgi:hypothetical protein
MIGVGTGSSTVLKQLLDPGGMDAGNHSIMRQSIGHERAFAGIVKII